MNKSAFAIMAILSCGILTACGGGGSGSGGSSKPVASTLGGVAAVGTPIVGGNVNVSCATGVALVTTTSNTGSWQVTLSGQALPCAVQVTGGTINGLTNVTSYQSIAIVGGTVNITPLTDLLVANLVGMATPGIWFNGLSNNPGMLAALTQGQVDAALSNLRSALSGLTPLMTINPVTTVFAAIPSDVSDDMLTALASALTSTGVTYTSLLSNASTAAFPVPVTGFNTTLTTAYAGTVSGAALGGSGAGTTIVGTQMGGARQGVALSIAAGSGVVSTIAGDSSFGSADGIGTAATFYAPSGITTDGINLYVAERWNNTIRKMVIATGQVVTLAGSRWVTPASIDGIGTAASFNQPTCITTDGTSLFVVDSMTNKIRRIDIASGVVTTLAGSGLAGASDGAGAVASFNAPGGLTTDGTNLYVADTNNNKIRKIVIVTGQVTTLPVTGLLSPSGITTDGTNVYVGDSTNLHRIVLATGTVTTMGSGLSGLTNLTTDGSNLFAAGSGSIRKIAIATATVSTLAGGTSCGGGYACGFGLDGTGPTAKFNLTDGITTDGTALYVTDRNGYYGNFIRKIQ